MARRCLAGPKVKPLAFSGPPGGPYIATAPDGKDLAADRRAGEAGRGDAH